MIDKIFEQVMRTIERGLAIGFIVAVCLNFANVIGRYVFGRSILGVDEVQIFILVWMTFLGAVVVTWRNQHLRMDVLVQFFPERIRTLLKTTELVLLLFLAGFVLLHSSRYAGQMMVLGRKSDMAGISMWIPHSAVAVGFGLIALIALWRVVQLYGGGGRMTSEQAEKTLKS